MPNVLALDDAVADGATEEKKRIKSRLAPSIRHSFLYMNPGVWVAHSGLPRYLAVSTAAACAAKFAPAVSPSEARKAIQERVAMDRTQSHDACSV